ncbi:MAG: D-glycero-beta-D-manno-heptose 1-phosphate adenylyltransferase [Kouleothrix sp.]|nr:D-glycero-beta-D-manno-heptose 1-phosphate adenylyltransferase [Kouleothrix sp.]
MSGNLSRLIDSFAGLDVLVIGDAMLDSYLEGTASGLCREAPVPVVALAGRVDVPGGAANTAANLRALGGRVRLLSVVGDDPEAGLLRRALDRYGVGIEDVLTQPGRRTLAKQRVVASSQVLVRFDQGSSEPIDQAAEAALIERLAELFHSCDAAIISDYSYGVLTPRVIRAIGLLQSGSPRVLVADSRRLAAYSRVGVTAVKPNYREAIELLGDRPPVEDRGRVDWVAARGEQLLELTGAQIAAVTLDADGALVVERGSSPYRTYARRAHNAQPAGAGDTFLSALTLALAAGADTPSAGELASAAAAIVVGKQGTATCSGDELRAAISADGKYSRDLDRLVALVELYRQQGRRVVFTNGCFDILHRGHVTYLSRAKALGDVLIVGVNGDAGVRRLKGPTRPINTLEDRAQVLAALSCVDHLVAFDEETPIRLIRALRPDVFVKGGDYTREKLPEAPVVEALGGVVYILPYLQDRSTTGIIERIRAANAEPRQRTAGESYR